MINESINKTKLISYQLMPNLLMDYGLIYAVESFCTKLNMISHIKINLTANKKFFHISKTHEIVIYRIVIELINNTIRHAEASLIEIDIKEQKNKLILIYKDNGKGFEVDNKLKSTDGLGLQNIIHRLNSIGGMATFESQKLNGMKALITLMLNK